MVAGKRYILFAILLLQQSCKKMDDDGGLSCSEKVIAINIIATPSNGCGDNSGAISATATGSKGFTFSINSGSFQASPNFRNLKNGFYIITARDAQGCEQRKADYVGSGIAPGPGFRALKELFAAKCNRCHAGESPAALKDWSVDCTILDYKQLINTRAVVIGDMPKGGPMLSTAEKNIITDWLAAGGSIQN